MSVNGDGLYDWDKDTKEYVFPDQLDFKKEPFATVIPVRSVSFKVHKTEGLANSALSHHRQGAKYKQENGVWVKVWEFTEPTNCDHCQVSLDPKVDKNRDCYGYLSGWLRSPLHKGSAIFAPFLCKKCYDLESQEHDERRKAREWRRQQKQSKT